LRKGGGLNKQTYESWSRVLAFLLKLIGVLGILFVPIFWAFTSRIELAFLPFFGTLAGVGQGLDVLKEISQGRLDNGPRMKGAQFEEQPENGT
jgi:hypothetical protein